MADPVEIVLDFLQRHQFAKAEAAFKTELLARGKGERPPLSSENVLDWDLHLSPHVLQGIDSSVTIADEQMATSMPERDTWRVSTKEDGEAGGMSLERVRSPPEKQLYVEYESGKPESQDSLCTPSHEFAFENVRTSQEDEAAVPLAGAYVSSPIYEVETAVQGASWITSIQQVEKSLPGMQSASSSEPLPVENQAWQFNSERAEQASTWDNEGMCQKQHLKPTTAFDSLPGSRNQAQQQQLHKNEMLQKEFDIKCDKSGIPCNTFACGNAKQAFKDLEKQDHSSLQNEVKAPRSNLPAVKGQVEGSSEKVEQRGEGILQVKNGFITSLTSEGSFKGTTLKTLLPLSSLKPSPSHEQQRVLMSDFSILNDQKIASGLSWNGGEVEKFEETRVPVIGNGAVGHPPYVENLDLSSNGVHGPEELPRPPPVRLHSMDKNMSIFKNGGSAVENESSTRGFESAALRSIGGAPEGTFGWGALVDGSLGQDMPISGLKWPVLRPSVSQGIVEATPEQLSGFAMAADGQSEKWYPDEYCDSDTYEDDDDPGYHRQPIEDEEWFFAHEIDYPSDEERARQHTDKNTLTVPKQSKKLDEDGGSFVEEESYFSGEEYYKLQAAKKELYKSQQSELRNQVDQAQFTYTSLYSTDIDNDLSTMSRGDDDGNKYDGQVFDTEELSLMKSQPVWKGFMGQANELEQDDVVLGGYRLQSGCADGVDDDNHGSVRSGGILVSSDAADVGSEVRDSLLGGSSEGDPESFREQELVAYGPARGKFDSEGFLNNKEGRHVEVKSAPVQHLDEDDDEHDMILQYYNEAWGHSKRANEREASSRSTTEVGVSTNELSKSKHLANCSNKAILDNGGFGFEGFSFPSPSSTGDVEVSRAGSGKSLWSNRESTAQGEETDGYGSSMVGPDDTLAAWKQKSNHSSPIIGSSEENLPNLNLSNHSSLSFHSTDEYVSLEAREHGLKESDVGCQLPKVCQPSAQEEEDAAAAQEELRTLGADEDQYEIFDLRIIHRKNRTGFEEDKEFAVMINSVIAGRYHVTEYLGSAAFSKAIQAHDLHTGMDVCMKIIKNNKDFFDQSLDEIKLLKFINKHDPADKYHILRLYDYFYHREHLFIVCELLRANLYEFHKFNRESGGEVYFTMPRLQSITRQCLEALEFLHRLGIIHCDLKPENILVKSYSRCEIKIIDLGSSCFQTDHLCSYVQSRSYRAPEVILGLPYDQKIDIWSLGCILAELCTGNVLFQNDSLATLLARVVGILGPIDPEVLTKGRDTHKYFTKNHMLYERNQETDQLEYLLPKKTSLSHRLPMGDQGFVEFVRYLLQSNPAKRPSATEALQHPWLSYPYEPISS